MNIMTRYQQDTLPTAFVTMSDPVPMPPSDPPRPVPMPPSPPRGPDLPEVPIEEPTGPDTPLPGDPETPPAGDPPTNPPVRMVEIGGPAGPEPTRYGDWEQKGRCTDF